MSHGPGMITAMNRSSRSKKCLVPVALSWSLDGAQFRVTAWPEVQFERRYGDEWISVVVHPDVLSSPATLIEAAAWRAYLEFVPTEVREFIGFFRTSRLAALHVAARCPAMVAALAETPALTAFVIEHAMLGTPGSAQWNELNAVYDRCGVFGLLDRLALPSSRDTLAILRNVIAPDLAPSLLASLRKILWQPQGIFALAKLPAITDRDVAHACHALAA